MAFKYINNSDIERINNQERVGFFLHDNYLFEGEVQGLNREYKKIDVIYNNNLESTTIENINELLEKAFNNKRDIRITEADFKRADFIELAFINNKLVGVARLITDGVGEALLLNVAVDKDYRGYGIGHEIIRRLASQADGYDIFIHTHPKAIGFYNNSRDFKRYKTAFTYVGDKEYNHDFFLPRDYRYEDEYDNKEIKYYKGKVFN
ncbi:MAG: GNAT family N-acetyltransferase [Acholeplasmatales bacterium]|nr:GNAT family N-acetyltransferase [Acholeplasmatales bacterium]